MEFTIRSQLYIIYALTVYFLDVHWLLQNCGWLADLKTMGYDDPLPAPSAGVQATLAAIHGLEIHQFIQTTDKEALLDKDEDGEHAPLLLSTLDLSHWTIIMYTSTQDDGVEKALSRLREAHEVLANLLEKDELDLQEALTNTQLVEVALRSANPHEDWSHKPPPTRVTETITMHPMVNRLNIPPAEKPTIEDFGECIQNSQMEQDIVSQDAAGKGPAIPFLPARNVEVKLNTRSHRSWCLNNINLLAPIPISVWKIWGNLSDTEVKACEDKTLNAHSQDAESHAITNAFPLVLYDHHKCPTNTVKVFTKQDMLTCHPRDPHHTSKLWNCRRPYLRCACSQYAKRGCKGNLIWFDQGVWFMLNNLERFFDNDTYPSLASKFGAFLTWVSAAAAIATKLQISFIAYRRMMEIAAVEFAANPRNMLLARYGDAAGARQIEKLFKPASFTTESTPSPSPVHYPRKRRINMNVTPETSGQQNQFGSRNQSSEPRHTFAAAGRGRYNRNFRPANRGSTGNNSRFMQSPMQTPTSNNRSFHSFSQQTPPSASALSDLVRPCSPLKGRVLNWDNL